MEIPGPDQPVRNGQAREAALRMVRSQHLEAEAAINSRIETIRSARLFGATWDEIGAAMGMSRQTAHKRFGPYVD